MRQKIDKNRHTYELKYTIWTKLYKYANEALEIKLETATERKLQADRQQTGSVFDSGSLNPKSLQFKFPCQSMDQSH